MMNIQLLPGDVARLIFDFLTSKQRAGICSVSKWFETTAIEVSKRLSLTPELYHWNRLHKVPKNKCEQISVMDYHLIVRLKQIGKLDFSVICKGQDLDVIGLCTDHEGDIINLSSSLATVVKTGRIDIVKILLSNLRYRDPDVSKAITAASKIGRLDILELLCEKKSRLSLHISESITAASKHGHIDVIMYFKNKCGYTYLDCCLTGASKGGHVDVIDLAYDEYREMHGDVDEDTLNDALGTACWNNQPKAVMRLIELGATYCDNCERGAANH